MTECFIPDARIVNAATISCCLNQASITHKQHVARELINSYSSSITYLYPISWASACSLAKSINPTSTEVISCGIPPPINQSKSNPFNNPIPKSSN